MRISNIIRKLEDTTIKATKATRPKLASAGRTTATYAVRATLFIIVAPAVAITDAIDGVVRTANATTKIDLRDKRMAVRR